MRKLENRIADHQLEIEIIHCANSGHYYSTPVAPGPPPPISRTEARQSSVFPLWLRASLTYQDSHFCSRDSPGASRSELDADCRRFVVLYTRHTFAFATRARHTVPPTLHLFVRAENDHERSSYHSPLGDTRLHFPSPWATVSFSSSSEGSPLGPAISESHCYADTLATVVRV